ncbi:hypothetical protein [Aminobacter phage Erebus]|nr:hypothetical protein [Aminobacter phage Erebus]
MTDAQIWTELVKWLMTRTGLTVIKTEQSGPRPALPYMALGFLGTAEVRELPQEVSFEDVMAGDPAEPAVKATPIIETEWRFSLHAYGPTPTDHLRPLRSAMHLAQLNEPLMPGLVLHELSQVRNLPEYINETWEPRAQMDVFVRGLAKDGFLVDVIEQYSFDIERIP